MPKFAIENGVKGVNGQVTGNILPCCLSFAIERPRLKISRRPCSLMSRQFCPSPWVVWKNVVSFGHWDKVSFFRLSDGLPTTHFHEMFLSVVKECFWVLPWSRSRNPPRPNRRETFWRTFFRVQGLKQGPFQGPYVDLVLALAQKKRNHNQNTSRPLCLVARENIQLA